MGQAKQRGTFEERQRVAIERDAEMLAKRQAERLAEAERRKRWAHENPGAVARRRNMLLLAAHLRSALGMGGRF